ncbi:MAG TPA: AbrB/MazE/SpoVT family DNA-binding domain-containing protein [Candidatus Bathyarchaeota archaeon]|nr:AbrB/MazE/SpoVT family DNA-binding domain-containing protein [Candidatus Bathyarchaeota archaeon]
MAGKTYYILVERSKEVVELTEYIVKVHRKGIIVLPSELRKKYGIKEGSEVLLIDEGEQVILLPRQGLEDLYGAARKYGPIIDKMIKELAEERELEARS